MHLSSICVLLVGLVLLIQLSVGAGQMMDPTPDPMNSCLFRGELFETDPIFPVKIFPSPDCIEVYCKETELGNSVDFVIVRGEDGCCELNGRLVPSGYTMYTGSCSQQVCTSTGFNDTTLNSAAPVPCPPGSVSVGRRRRRKKCVTVFPLTTNFTTAVGYCRDMGGRLPRPFRGRGDGNQRLVNAIGQVNGWLNARQPGRPRWPRDGRVTATPSSAWYDDKRIFRANASGCMGYRFDNNTSSTNSSGGWDQYSCSDELQPICEVPPQRFCSRTTCPGRRPGIIMQHDEIISHPAICLNIKCWFGQRRLVKDPMCCTLEEPNGNTTATRLYQEGTFDTALQTCTCREARLTCSNRVVSNCTMPTVGPP